MFPTTLHPEDGFGCPRLPQATKRFMQQMTHKTSNAPTHMVINTCTVAVGKKRASVFFGAFMLFRGPIRNTLQYAAYPV